MQDYIAGGVEGRHFAVGEGAFKKMDAFVSRGRGRAGLGVTAIGSRLDPHEQMRVPVQDSRVKAPYYLFDPIVRGRQAVAEKEDCLGGKSQFFADGETGPPLRLRGVEEPGIDAPKHDTGIPGGGRGRGSDRPGDFFRIAGDEGGLGERRAAEEEA